MSGKAKAEKAGLFITELDFNLCWFKRKKVSAMQTKTSFQGNKKSNKRTNQLDLTEVKLINSLFVFLLL